MSDSDELSYFLPLTSVRFMGSVVCTSDAILKTETCEPSSCIADVLVAADRSNGLKLKIEHGWFRDTNVSFELTEDGRLSSSSAEATGQAGKFVTGVLGVAVTAAGLALAGPPGAVAGAVLAGAARAAQRQQGLKDKTPEQVVEDAYREKHGEMADLRDGYSALVLSLPARMAELTTRLADEPQNRIDLLQRLRGVHQALEMARAEMATLDRHFAAWRATTIKTRTESIEVSLTLDELRAAGVGVKNGQPDPADEGTEERKKVLSVWKQLGAVVVLEDLEAPPAAQAAADDSSKVTIREPRMVKLTLYRTTESGLAEPIQAKPYLVMDGECGVQRIPLPRKRFFSKRTTALKFSAGGALTSYSSGSTAAAAAVGDLAGSIPGTVASSLEQSGKIADSLAGLRSKSLDEQLATTKKQVELKQQQIAAAGLEATQDDAAELERLKQRTDILEARHSIGETSLALDPAAQEVLALQQEIELLKATRQASAAGRALAAELELGDLRLEIERLRVENNLLKAKGGDS